MRGLRKVFVFVSLMAFGLLAAPAARAVGLEDWPTTATFDEPIQIGDLVLPPGTYYFKLTPGTVARNIMMIYSMDRRRWEGMIMGIHANREDIDAKGELMFGKKEAGKPAFLEYWFNPDWNRGIQFINPGAKDGRGAQLKLERETLTAHNSR